MNRWKGEFFDVGELVEGPVCIPEFDGTCRNCEKVYVDLLFNRKDIFMLGANLENDNPEEELEKADWKMQLEELGTNTFQLLNRYAEIFVFLILIFIQLVHLLFIDELSEFIGSINDEQHVCGKDVENVGEE